MLALQQRRPCSSSGGGGAAAGAAGARSQRGRCVAAPSARPGLQLDTLKTAQTAEVAVLIPVVEDAYGPPLPSATTARHGGGINVPGALVAALLAAGFVANKLRRRG